MPWPGGILALSWSNMSGGQWLSSVLDPEMEHWPAVLPKAEEPSPAT